MKKKKTKKKTVSVIPSAPFGSVRIALTALGIALIITGGVFAAIRMTDDPKPKRIIYRVKDVNSGSITTKYESEDEDFHYNVGDFFEQPDNAHPNGEVKFIMVHKYVVIAKKEGK